VEDIGRTETDEGPGKGGKDNGVVGMVALISCREVERAWILGECKYRRAIGIPIREDNMESSTAHSSM